MKRLAAAAIVIVAILVGGGIFAGSQVAAKLSGGPEQPVAFPHSVHVVVVGLDCTFCHRNADKGAAATVPAVEQCMFCHKVVQTGSPEIQKVVSAWENQQPINWVRVHRLPDTVQFVHEPHIRAGFQCSTCHGEVQTMIKVRQVRPLKMGDCVSCHRQNNGPTDCAVCHK